MAELGEHHVQRGRLGLGPREAVQDEARMAVVLAQALSDDVDHDLVWHQVAPVHDLLRALAQLRPTCSLGAKDVAGGYLGNSEARAKEVGLGTLAASGGAVNQ